MANGLEVAESPIDLSNLSSLKQQTDIALSIWGSIDILINNIGHTLNVKDPFCSIEDWKKVMNLNFFTSVMQFCLNICSVLL